MVMVLVIVHCKLRHVGVMHSVTMVKFVWSVRLIQAELVWQNLMELKEIGHHKVEHEIPNVALVLAAIGHIKSVSNVSKHWSV